MTLTGQEVAEVSHVEPRQFRACVAIVSMFGSSLQTFLPRCHFDGRKAPGVPTRLRPPAIWSFVGVDGPLDARQVRGHAHAGALCGQDPRCATTLCARPTRSRARLRNRGMSRVDERSTDLSCGRTPQGLARGRGR